MPQQNTTWRPIQTIRPLSVGLIRRSDELLLMAVRDDRGSIKGWRPPGGGIEFGESAEDALVRELLEEIGERVECKRQVCVLENIYRHEGAPGHEVVFVFEVAFLDRSAYARERYKFIDQGVENIVEWRKLSAFYENSEPLFPNELRNFLSEELWSSATT